MTLRRESVFIENSAEVDDSARIGAGSRIWHGVQIRGNVDLGENVTIGKNSYIGEGVRIGNNCKIQNNCQIYEPATIEDGVFIGPSCVFTNDTYPRAITPSGVQKTGSEWQKVGVEVLYGASIGAGTICVAPVKIGKWALIGAGSVVVSDIGDFALALGAPARRIGWVGKGGVRLKEQGAGSFTCPVTGQIYFEREGNLYEYE